MMKIVPIGEFTQKCSDWWRSYPISNLKNLFSEAMEAIEDIKMASVYFKANKNPCDTFNLCDTKLVQNIILITLRVLQIQAILFLKPMSESVGSDIERL